MGTNNMPDTCGGSCTTPPHSCKDSTKDTKPTRRNCDFGQVRAALEKLTSTNVCMQKYPNGCKTVRGSRVAEKNQCYVTKTEVMRGRNDGTSRGKDWEAMATVTHEEDKCGSAIAETRKFSFPYDAISNITNSRNKQKRQKESADSADSGGEYLNLTTTTNFDPSWCWSETNKRKFFCQSAALCEGQGKISGGSHRGTLFEADSGKVPRPQGAVRTASL
ncbi:hypothetical protein RUM43_012657 [Polyplax serrata]|uniref:Uncharacterized protein n=1 Tax=Polyplax serrata TaxID=468196 RepID=A0AAN8PSW9_POLSC